ncbi:M23 family metallopeptidase [Cohnella terricola]|uniref:M23 family metallopeptidase n=1 Tax=Cohnella terricola TaxID=1289167 RepID=A0A559JMK5_9BACL|nr:M23 family metallopeptidase [Cohnella terricola]TVY01111.1 M23 family metallopeptidase [Cohnella terricola]
MAHYRRKAKWSFILIRDADHRVKQFRVSGRTVAFLPVAAALTVAGGFAGTELQALHRIHDLEFLLADNTGRYDAALAGRNGEIHTLREELRVLNGETQQLQERMNALAELETKLRRFIEKYGDDPILPAFGKSGSSDSEVAASTLMGSSSDKLSATAVESTIADFSELSQMLDEMAASMEANLRKVEQRRAEFDALPSGWPTVSRKLTSGFGYRSDPFTGKSTFHAGVDITGDVGDPIFAAGDGTVKVAEFNLTRGNYIIIAHRNGLESWYMHLSKIEVNAGQQLKRGDKIGKMGNSGRSTGPHLHFQVVASEEPVNPLPYLRQIKED